MDVKKDKKESFSENTAAGGDSWVDAEAKQDEETKSIKGYFFNNKRTK